jgi:hypothetical protein
MLSFPHLSQEGERIYSYQKQNIKKAFYDDNRHDLKQSILAEGWMASICMNTQQIQHPPPPNTHTHTKYIGASKSSISVMIPIKKMLGYVEKQC